MTNIFPIIEVFGRDIIYALDSDANNVIYNLTISDTKFIIHIYIASPSEYVIEFYILNFGPEGSQAYRIIIRIFNLLKEGIRVAISL
jgi:hypothetical protein